MADYYTLLLLQITKPLLYDRSLDAIGMMDHQPFGITGHCSFDMTDYYPLV